MTQRGFAIIPTIAAIVVTGITLSLGNWQLRRADEKTQMAQVREIAARAAPVAITDQLAVAQTLDNKQVTVTGWFEPEDSIFIDNRTHNGRAGFHVVTPLRIMTLADGLSTRIAVLRGWVPRDIKDRSRLPELRVVNGPVTITGLAQMSLGKVFDIAQLKSADPAAMPVPDRSQRIWQQFAIDPYAKWLGGSGQLQGVLIRQTVSIDDGLIRDWPQPANDVNKHLGYAFQWFGLSALTVFLWGFYAWRGRKSSEQDLKQHDN